MSNVPILILGLALTGLVASLACASPSPTGELRPELAAPARSAEPTVHPSIEAAVDAAFAAADRTAGPAERDRLQMGTIRRVEGGFIWLAPALSSTSIGAMSPMRVRLRLAPEDVAIYGLHPRSGLADLDRANEGVTRPERRLVDEQDPLHRPLYVRTPSRRVVRYPAAQPEAVEFVRREEAEEGAGAGLR
ncbi:MAG: hypothetical protein U0900_04425 [Myxococcota bacterium]